MSQARISRKLRVFIILSAALNVLFLSFVIGAIIHGGPSRGDQTARADLFRVYVRALDGSDKRSFFQSMHRHHPKRGGAAPHAQIQELLTQSPLDPEALRLAFEKHGASISERNAAALDAYVAIVAAMSDDERAAYANAVQTQLDEMAHKRRARKKD